MIFASVIVKDVKGSTGKVLICRRSPADKWEFPCSKLRTNETPGRGVVRIAWEQLGMGVTPGILHMRGRRKSPGTLYDFHEYYEAVNTWHAEPAGNVFSETAWVHPSELGQYEFDGDDKAFVSKYLSWITGGEIKDAKLY